MATIRKEEEEISAYPEPFCENISFFPGKLDFSMSTKMECADGRGSVKNLTPRTAKIIILGESAVGKTSLVNRYFHDSFEKVYKATIGVDFMCQQFRILGIPFRLQIWDTAGAERFRSLTYTYFRQARAVLLVFDMNEESSLDKIRTWHNDAVTYCGRPFDTFLVGSKLDLCSHDHDKSKAHKIAKELNAEYWETSSKARVNVEKMFTRVAAVVFERIIESEIDSQQQKQATIGPANTLIRVDEKPATKKNKKIVSFC